MKVMAGDADRDTGGGPFARDTYDDQTGWRAIGFALKQMGRHVMGE